MSVCANELVAIEYIITHPFRDITCIKMQSSLVYQVMPLNILSFQVAYPTKTVMPLFISLPYSLNHRITPSYETGLLWLSRLVSNHKYAILFEGIIG